MATNLERRAKLVRSGGGQSVRLPKEFAGDEVRIERMGDGVVLDPIVRVEVPSDWSWLREIQGTFDESFFAAIDELRREEPQERPELDKLFR